MSKQSERAARWRERRTLTHLCLELRLGRQQNQTCWEIWVDPQRYRASVGYKPGVGASTSSKKCLASKATPGCSNTAYPATQPSGESLRFRLGCEKPATASRP